MDIALKYKILEKIIQTDDDTLLNEISSLVGLSESDFWNDVPDGVKQLIDQAKGELDRGEGVPHAEVMADIKNRFLSK